MEVKLIADAELEVVSKVKVKLKLAVEAEGVLMDDAVFLHDGWLWIGGGGLSSSLVAAPEYLLASKRLLLPKLCEE